MGPSLIFLLTPGYRAPGRSPGKCGGLCSQQAPDSPGLRGGTEVLGQQRPRLLVSSAGLLPRDAFQLHITRGKVATCCDQRDMNSLGMGQWTGTLILCDIFIINITLP